MQNSLCLFGILCVFNVVERGALTSRSRRCQSTQQNIHGCCDGYKWDVVDNDCIKCSPGYTGVGCSIRCSYPLFGDYCQKICMCSPDEFCDNVSGCLKYGIYLNEQGINKNSNVTVNETGSTGIPATEITTDKDRNYTNRFVDKSKPSQEILERSNWNNTRSTPGNLIQGNWKLITILLLVLSCIVLSITYCQPTFIRIREFLTRLMSASQP